MKALLCKEFGPLDTLATDDIPAPEPRAGQLLVEVRAAALNYPDALTVQGLYQIKPKLPFCPGSEVAGVVREVGEGVEGLAPGDRVMAIARTGGLAEYCLADAVRTVPLADNVDYDVGASVLVTYGTALHALQRCGKLQQGETLLVLGAAGGTGTAAIEVGKRLGARVIAAASDDDKLALCRTLGADDTINYAESDLRDATLALTDGRGADVVFDPVGGPFTERAVRATAWHGRLLVIGFAAGDIPRLPLNLALLMERSVIGVNRGGFFQRDPAGYQRDMIQVGDWLASGELRPAVTERIRLEDAPDALRRLMDRQVKGKVVVRFDI